MLVIQSSSLPNMFTTFTFIYVILLVSAVRSASIAPSALNITNEVCQNAGFWTDWFSMYNGANSTTHDPQITANTVKNVADVSCFSIIGVEMEQIQEPGSNSFMAVGIASTTAVDEFLYSYEETLSQIDFQVRFCCSDGFGVMTTWPYIPQTEEIDPNFIPTTTEDPSMSETATPSSSIPIQFPLMSADNVTCGKQQIAPRPSLTSRIFGGTDAIANSWPWMINYRMALPSESDSLYIGCGGTLISQNYVLTAAHCIEMNEPSEITLTAGMQTQSSLTESNTRQVRAVQSIYIHPLYDSDFLSNDIALLRVNGSFEYTKYVQPACLPAMDPQVGDDVMIIGWGSEQLEDTVTDTLQQAPTSVVGNCDRYWPEVNTRLQICVANAQNGDSACQGDSGGPMLNQNNGQYVVSGVASFSRSCRTTGEDNYPNVYTRVSAYKSWIDRIINGQP